MKTYIPLNTINSDFDKATLRDKLDKATEDKKRLQKYNLNLKLDIIKLRETINNIKKTNK
tara:strand:- start:4 stop:183 length:180 start_codon:yes stop_codon:yes gene_type:complete